MKKSIVTIITFISLIVLTMGMINGDERPIYVGDVIELNIDSRTYSVSDIELAFDEFEIIELTRADKMYSLKIRSFEVGEHIVNLGNTDLVISIASMLSEDENELKIANVELEKVGVVLPWSIIKFVFLTISLIGVVVFMVIWVKDRPKKQLSNHDQFIIAVKLIKIDDKDYAYKLTLLFKEYLSKQFVLSLSGLTRIELINCLSSVQAVKASLSIIDLWLSKCDTFKYSKDKASIEAKEILRQELLAFVDSINKNCEVTE